MEPKIHDKILLNKLAPADKTKIAKDKYRGADCCSTTTAGDDGGDQTSIRLLFGWPLFVSYGVGHVFNDMIASMWFAYALVYYRYVISMSPSEAGYVLLVGQLTDAVATAAIGIVSDNTENCLTARYGRRKTWHLLGSILVFASLPFAFSPPIFSEIYTPVYYCFFVVFFQIGWACIENSHMALASDLTPSKSGRTALMSIRYSFTVFSNIFVYVITWSVLLCTGASEQKLQPQHCGQIQVVVLAVMIVGAIATIVFHVGVHEPLVNRIGNNREDRELLVTENESSCAGNRMWSTFKSVSLYQTAFVYMGSRILVNMTSVFLPLYLQNYLNTKSEKLALLPLIMYLSSFGMSFFNQPLNMKIGRKCTYLLGVVMAICAAVWCFIGSNEPSFRDYQIYGVTTIVGIACSVILVTSQALTTDFIGNKTNQGAFIFGLMSFTDKVSNGIVIEVIQALDNKKKNDPYYRNIMIIIWTIPSCLAYIMIMSLPYGGRPSKEISKHSKSNTSHESEKNLEAQPIMIENAHYT